MDFLKEAHQLTEEITRNRRYLHQNAEVGFELLKTTEFVKEKLNEIGCEAAPCGKNGLVACIGNGKGKTFLLRADMDALPIQEETDLPFACKESNMHACGHDMHTAMLLGAARLLKANEHKINGTVKLMLL